MLLNNIKFTKTNIGRSQMTSGDAFRVTLTYKGKRCSFIFNDNYLNNSTKEEVIDCLLLDAEAYSNSRDFADFALEFGYNDDSMTAYKIYNAYKKQAEKVKRLFTAEEVQQLREEINL